MKKLNNICLVTAILTLGITSTAFAEEKKQEIGVNGFYQNQVSPSGGSDTLFLQGHYGRYFKPQLLGTVNVLGITSGSASQTIGAGVGAKYYFKVGQKGDFVPFVDADVMVLTVKSAGVTSTPVQLSAGGGASYFLSETTSFDARAALQFQTASGTNTTMLNMTVGMTQRF